MKKQIKLFVICIKYLKLYLTDELPTNPTFILSECSLILGSMQWPGNLVCQGEKRRSEKILLRPGPVTIARGDDWEKQMRNSSAAKYRALYYTFVPP